MRKSYHLVWVLILFCLALIISVLLFSGNISLFLSPRMKAVVIFGLSALVALLLYQIYKILSGKEKGERIFKFNYLMFMIPLFLFFTAPPNADTINQLPNQEVNISYGAKAVEQEDSQPIEKVDETNTPQPTETLNEENTYIENTPTPIPEETPELSEESSSDDIKDPENLVPCIVSEDILQDVPSDMFEKSLYYDVEQMCGTEVTMHGFVLKDESFPENVIVVARYIVSCCIADAVPAGFPVKVENADELVDNEWIVVTGIVDKIRMDSYGVISDYPIMTDGIITRRDTPDLYDQYIYP